MSGVKLFVASRYRFNIGKQFIEIKRFPFGSFRTPKTNPTFRALFLFCQFVLVYNLILEEWAEIVEKKIMPDLPLEDVSGEMKLHLKMELVNMIGKNNILNSLMNKLEVFYEFYEDFMVEYCFLFKLVEDGWDGISQKVALFNKQMALCHEILGLHITICFPHT